MDPKDTRWKQRFSNYRKALAKMEEVVSGKKIDELSEVEKEGLVHRLNTSMNSRGKHSKT